MPHITRLALTHFRTYSWLELKPNLSSVALVGANGVGKTNILEAISLLGPGRGLRRAELTQLRQAGTASQLPWGVVATVQNQNTTHELGTARAETTSTDDSETAERRQAHIDGSACSASALTAHLPLVWLTPDMDRLLAGDKSDKRRFFDRLVSQFDAAHQGRLTRYDKLLRERIQLLISAATDEAWLNTLEADIASTGVAIAAARLALADALSAKAPGLANHFPAVSLHYLTGVEAWLVDQSALAAEDKLRAALANNRARDRKTESTEFGPHRSDFTAFYTAKNLSADYCSTGEQKALLITLLLSHAALLAEAQNSPPVILLDEIASHLDSARRQNLFVMLHALGAQVWLTGTESALFKGFPGPLSLYEVSHGRVQKA